MGYFSHLYFTASRQPPVPGELDESPDAFLSSRSHVPLLWLALFSPGDLPDVDLTGPHCWVLGNEAWGLEQEVRDACDEVVRVPILGKAESLNLAMAATVCLYASAGVLR